MPPFPQQLATMTVDKDSLPTTEIDLRNPVVAGLIAWLVPGAGHFYQRRFGKGMLFLVCILGTFFYGVSLGSAQCVYFQWKKGEHRWQYFCQAGAGLVTLPAALQAFHQSQKNAPFLEGQWRDFMRAPNVSEFDNDPDQLADLHYQLKWKFELGTLYTMIAGLLNLLAIYDAVSGPFIAVVEEKKDSRKNDD